MEYPDQLRVVAFLAIGVWWYARELIADDLNLPTRPPSPEPAPSQVPLFTDGGLATNRLKRHLSEESAGTSAQRGSRAGKRVRRHSRRYSVPDVVGEESGVQDDGDRSGTYNPADDEDDEDDEESPSRQPTDDSKQKKSYAIAVDHIFQLPAKDRFNPWFGAFIKWLVGETGGIKCDDFAPSWFKHSGELESYFSYGSRQRHLDVTGFDPAWPFVNPDTPVVSAADSEDKDASNFEQTGVLQDKDGLFHMDRLQNTILASSEPQAGANDVRAPSASGAEEAPATNEAGGTEEAPAVYEGEFVTTRCVLRPRPPRRREEAWDGSGMSTIAVNADRLTR
ncbi:hypothetical protein L226DRAFT_306267 [Lentinus tigrinus ALCF2SS1-7]|nr:hypothetical protein L226DRAFT_306267 [Lentinus tigrinus ALCF2SS1-7]